MLGLSVVDDQLNFPSGPPSLLHSHPKHPGFCLTSVPFGCNWLLIYCHVLDSGHLGIVRVA